MSLLKTIKILVTVISVFPINYCAAVKYYNFTLFRGIPVNNKHVEFFNNLSNTYAVNFWRRPGAIFKPVDLVVQPDEKTAFLEDVERNGIYLTTIMANVQKAFDMQKVRTYIRRKMNSFSWDGFYRLEDIYNWLTDLQKSHPKEIKLQSIGRTHEGRDIVAVRVVLKNAKIRSKVIIEGGVHAREWIAPAFVTYFINEIIHAAKSRNKVLRDIARIYEWYFIPVLNPDGYEYTHTHDRLWRKNRNHKYGVDINRNFGVAFGRIGVSWNSQDQEYCGESAFSENESTALANFINSKNDSLEYYLSFHSYGQYIIIPYSHSTKHWDNFETVRKMGQQAAFHIYQKNETNYLVGTAYDTVGYMASGVSSCWVKNVFRVPYVLTFELPDTGAYGFALPPEKIRPVCEETMDGVLSLLVPRTQKYIKLEGKGITDGSKHSVLDEILSIEMLLTTPFWNYVVMISATTLALFQASPGLINWDTETLPGRLNLKGVGSLSALGALLVLNIL